MTSGARLLWMLRTTIVSLVRQDSPDFTARQLAVLLICELDAGPHTVRGLAARLNVPGSAITRALNRLEESDLAMRLPDPSDRRSVLVGPTVSGDVYVKKLRALMEAAENAGRRSPT